MKVDIPQWRQNTLKKERFYGKEKGHITAGLSVQAQQFPWPTLSIRKEDLVTSPNGNITDVLRIVHETDLKRSASYRSITSMIKQLRKRRREVSRLISRKSYDSIVKRNTKGSRVIRVWTGEYYTEFSNGATAVWKVHGPELELSKKEFLHRLLDEPGVPNRLKPKIRAALRHLEQHPDDDFLVYDVWQDFLGYACNVVSPGGEPIRIKPRSVLRKVPVRDWSKIRIDWLRFRKRVQEKLEHIDALLAKLLTSRSKYELHTQLRWNRMYQIGTCAQIPHSHGEYPHMFGIHPLAPARICFRPESGQLGTTDIVAGPESRYIDDRKHKVLCLFDEIRTVVSDPLELYRLYWSRLDELGRTLSGEEWGRFSANLPVVWKSQAELVYNGVPSDPDTDITVITTRSHENDDIFSPYRQSVPLSLGNESFLVYPFVDLDLIDLHDTEADLDDRRGLVVKQLLALDLKSEDKLVFNMARSVGELKDAPSTIRSGCEFINFARRAKGRLFYEVYTSSGHVVALQNANDTIGRLAHQVMRSQGYPPVCRSSALTKVGISKIVLRRVSALTNITRLASLYLAWKFGISQTISDTNTVIHHGWRACCAVRRGLSQLLVHLDSAKELHPIRRMFRVRSSVLPKNKDTLSYIERSIPVQTNDITIEDKVSFRHDLSCGINGEPGFRPYIPGHADWYIVESSLGFWYAAPTVSVNVLADARYAEAIQKHNDSRLFSLAVEHKVAPVLCFRNDIRGVIFAKFSWRSLLKAVRGSWKRLNANLKAFTTLWELAPLSFVVEWFSNMRTLVDSAQALIERTETKVYPIGKPWEMTSTSLWLGLANTQLASRVRIEPERSAMVLSGEELVAGTVDHPLVFRDLWVTMVAYEYRIEITLSPDPSIQEGFRMYKSSIRRAIRAPFSGRTDELPAFRVRLNLNTGKLGSLLAMIASKLK